MTEYHLSVNAAHTESLAAVLYEVRNKLLVYLARKHHLDDINGSFVGVSEAVYELALDAHTSEHIVYLRAAAVNENCLYADQIKEHDIAHYCILQFIIGHSVSAVLDNDYLVVVLLYVGQGVYEHLRTYLI